MAKLGAELQNEKYERSAEVAARDTFVAEKHALFKELAKKKVRSPCSPLARYHNVVERSFGYFILYAKLPLAESCLGRRSGSRNFPCWYVVLMFLLIF